MNAEKKVVQMYARNPSKTQTGPIVSQCRALFQQEFKPALDRFFTRVDDELFTLSDKASNNTLQELYFEAMRYLRRERDHLQRKFLETLLSQFDRFWNDPPKPAPVKSSEALQLDEDDFSIVEEEGLEEDLALSTLINKGNTLYHRELYCLNKRFAKLLGTAELSNEDNPLSPHSLGQAFAQVLRPLTLDLKVRLILFKLYEQEVIGHLGAFYDSVNEVMAKHGVLPEISKKIKKRRAGSANTGDRSENRNGSEASPSDQAAYVQAIQAMHSLLAAWRAQVGLPSLAASAGEPGVVVSDSQEVVGALSALQDPEEIAELTKVLQQSDDANLKSILADRLSRTHGGKRALAQIDEDVIDMIGMIFDFILEDRNLPDPVKALIGRLQIPIVKVAILDKSFFSKKNHPARLLLNRLAHAGIGLSDDERLESNPVFQQINQAVTLILNEFAQDVDLFARVLADFDQFMEQEGRRSQVLEERTRQATQSREHLLLAKKQVAEAMAVRLQDRELPPRLKRFFTTTWKDILLVACLRREREPEGWEAKLALTDMLLQSLTPPAQERERKKILRRIPGLLRALRKELETISLDPKQIALLFKELEQVHHAVLNHPQHEPIDPKLLRELEEISANLPEIDDLALEELTDFSEDEIEEEIIMVAEEEPETADQFYEQARKLEVGDWIELSDRNGKTIRAKLSWISKVTGLRVFVNRRGVKVAEHTLNGLAAELRRGDAKVIEGRVPLMDRALSAMMSTLKHPAKQTDEGVEDATLAL
ncbi:MAG TPA: DUF1631 domain-containing protein [Methylothermaceae bacterium]|nr:DUF1631 domain-containing protein [Methylothermaceae bacterium]